MTRLQDKVHEFSCVSNMTIAAYLRLLKTVYCSTRAYVHVHCLLLRMLSLSFPCYMHM